MSCIRANNFGFIHNYFGGTESLKEDGIKPGTYPADVYGCKRALEAFFRTEQQENAVRRIWELIKKDKHEREQSSDDDRLYWWDGTDEVILSQKMDEWLSNLARII